MALSTPSRFLALLILALLASCRSEQTVFQSSAPREQPVVSLDQQPQSLPSTTPLLVPTLPAKAATNRVRLHPPDKLARSRRLGAPKQPLVRLAEVAKRTARPGFVHKPNVAALRGVREEGEGKPALLVLGIVLVVAGVVSGLVIGGGIGFFVGLPIGLLGYYFFMKGLLGPNAWMEVANELFQL